MMFVAFVVFLGFVCLGCLFVALVSFSRFFERMLEAAQLVFYCVWDFFSRVFLVCFCWSFSLGLCVYVIFVSGCFLFF